MDLICERCHAKYEVELVDCEKFNKFSYYCIFCGNLLLEVNDKKKFLPKNVSSIPIPQIALPGLIYSTLTAYMEEYKGLFKELSIGKGQATSSLNISLQEDDFVPPNGWSYVQLEGLIDDSEEIKKSIEDLFKTPGMVLRIYILHDSREVQIPNIMVPYALRHRGIGKHLIALIYDLCKHFGYRLSIVQMVEGFYYRLLERGAEMIDEDSVEITDNTNLLN